MYGLGEIRAMNAAEVEADIRKVYVVMGGWNYDSGSVEGVVFDRQAATDRLLELKARDWLDWIEVYEWVAGAAEGKRIEFWVKG